MSLWHAKTWLNWENETAISYKHGGFQSHLNPANHCFVIFVMILGELARRTKRPKPSWSRQLAASVDLSKTLWSSARNGRSKTFRELKKMVLQRFHLCAPQRFGPKLLYITPKWQSKAV